MSKNIAIKSIPYALRPREKFKKYGATLLDNSELMAIILGSGVRGKNVLEVADSLIKKYSNAIFDADYKELMKEKGVGEVKAIQLQCAFELSKRLLKNDKSQQIINKPSDLFTLLAPYQKEKKEHLLAFYLGALNNFLGQEIISVGTVDTNLIHPREIFATALERRATGVIIAHNHPFGVSKPSNADLEITHKIAEAGNIIGVKLIDHIIVSPSGFFSFLESHYTDASDEPLYLRQGIIQKSLFDFYHKTPSTTVIARSEKTKTRAINISKIDIRQRRYLGNKHGVLGLIDEVIQTKIGKFESFCDIFAGTGVVGYKYNSKDVKIISNDLLFSNYITSSAFLGAYNIDEAKIIEFINGFNKLAPISDNYMSENFGGKYFSINTARKIGEVREQINRLFIDNKINFKEKCVLLTSLLYAMDRTANTVGHYDAYIKKDIARENFCLKFPDINYEANKDNLIYNQDANTLIREIECDVLYLDPPYNSRQYGDLYHLLENVMRWEKPQVHGEAKKFDRAHIKSEYNLKSATRTFCYIQQKVA